MKEIFLGGKVTMKEDNSLKWSYDHEFKRDSAKRTEEVIAFSKKFICNYNNQFSSLDSSHKIKTAATEEKK